MFCVFTSSFFRFFSCLKGFCSARRYFCEFSVLVFGCSGIWILQYFFSCVVGFNAPVAGTFFAIETVLRPQHAENSPPLTTAMIILAAVISSTVSQILLGERPAFTVPPYELRSAAGIILHKDV